MKVKRNISVTLPPSAILLPRSSISCRTRFNSSPSCAESTTNNGKRRILAVRIHIVSYVSSFVPVSLSLSHLFVHLSRRLFSVDSPLSWPSATPSLFQTHLFHTKHSCSLSTGCTGYNLDRIFWANRFLWPPSVADADIIFLPCGFYLLLSFLFFPRLVSAVADWMSTILLHIVCP